MPFVFDILPVLLLFLGAQVYFLWRGCSFLLRHIANRAGRIVAVTALVALYAGLLAANLMSGGRSRPTSTHMTPHDALINAPFLWWIFSSTVAFFVVLVVWLVRLAGHAFRRRAAAEAPASTGRREFLEGVATAAVAGPFVAGAYGLLWGRLNLRVTRQPIRIANLPRAFHGFRIAQLSDIHVGPFMSEDQIRKYVEMANELKPDLVALTGDFVTWDPSTAPVVVNALSGLKAPFGVFGSLGNHDAWADAEDLLTDLFAHTGVRILRQEHTPIKTGNEAFNLIGVDFTNSRSMSVGGWHLSSGKLEGVENLMMPGTANILLSHNPDSFDRAAELGIDLSLAGHTHGGQLALEFISPEIAPSRLVTPYVAGWFQKPGGQLYVNRGIGTIAAPMRVGAPPEITVYELLRA
ncbi:MAG: metallophosphoesterase [Acidobacteriia bacterium]|nr:metallophosphoesterase [Terriglobia bacterium]